MMNRAIKSNLVSLPYIRNGLFTGLGFVKTGCNTLPVVAVSIPSNGHVKVHLVVGIVGLGLPQIPLDPGSPEHDPGAAVVESVFGGQDADLLRPLHPETVVGHEIFDLVQTLRELGDELVDVVQETDGDVLVDAAGPDVGGVHPGAGSTLVELHHLLAFLEQPEERGDAANVQDVGADTHDVVQDPSQLAKHDWNE